MDTDTIDEQSNEPLSAKLWKAHRTISNDQSKMYTLLPILNSYLKQANVEFDTELFMCTLETILKLVSYLIEILTLEKLWTNTWIETASSTVVIQQKLWHIRKHHSMANKETPSIPTWKKKQRGIIKKLLKIEYLFNCNGLKVRDTKVVELVDGLNCHEDLSQRIKHS